MSAMIVLSIPACTGQPLFEGDWLEALSEATSSDATVAEAVLSGCDSGSTPGPTPECPGAAQLSDEFDDPCTLAAWQQENTALTSIDIDDRTPGQLTLTVDPATPPFTGWYQDYVGPLLHKPVSGDFIVRTRVNARNVADPGQAPSRAFNSAGLLLRDPASVIGDQDWLMFDIGYQQSFVGTESKTTQDSISVLTLQPSGGVYAAELLVCRVGAEVRMFTLLDGAESWVLENQYNRADLPATLDVGLIANAWEAPADLRAEYDYVRFSSPASAADCAVEALNLAYPPAGSTGGECPAAEGFSDEFDDPCTLEAWNQENLETVGADIDATRDGFLTLSFDGSTPPYSGWYQDFQGPVLHKPVTGDFLAITRVVAGSPADPAVSPSSQFNAAGLLVRDPASVNGDQDWIAFNLGFQEFWVGTEGKTTDDSVSILTLIQSGGINTARLALCRAGSTFRLFRSLEGQTGWTQVHVYDRPDLPETLDVGLMANAWEVPATIRPQYDYIRLSVPGSAAECSTTWLDANRP